jgi:hypothetical protein
MFIDVVYRKIMSCTKLVWCLMMNTCLCKHVFDDVHDVFNQFLSYKPVSVQQYQFVSVNVL